MSDVYSDFEEGYSRKSGVFERNFKAADKNFLTKLRDNKNFMSLRFCFDPLLFPSHKISNACMLISKNKNLRSLKFENVISSEEIEFGERGYSQNVLRNIAKTIRRIPSLKKLRLDFSHFKRVSPHDLRNIRDSFSNCKSLQSLSISLDYFTQINSDCLKHFSLETKRIRSILDFSLSCVEYSHVARGLHHMLCGLTKSARLKKISIDLSQVMLDDISLSYFEKFTRKCPNITSLRFDARFAKLKEENYQFLSQGIKSLNVLESLELNFYGADIEIAKNFFQDISKAPSLKSFALDLTTIDLDTNCTFFEGLIFLIKAAKLNCFVLDLQAEEIANDVYSQLEQAMTSLNELKVLKNNVENYRPIKGGYFDPAMNKNLQNLEELTVCLQCFTEFDFENLDVILNALSSLTNLKRFNLRLHQYRGILSGEEMKTFFTNLGAQLKESEFLHDLTLSFKEMPTEAALDLSAALKGLKSLKKLDLEFDSDQLGMVVQELLDLELSEVGLKLDSIGIPETLNALEMLIDKMKSLRKLKIDFWEGAGEIVEEESKDDEESKVGFNPHGYKTKLRGFIKKMQKSHPKIWFTICICKAWMIAPFYVD